MPLLKRTELPALLADPQQLTTCHLFLFFGERYLCREAADQVQQALLGNAGAVHPIDGDQEDSGQTLSRLMSFSLLPGNQIYRVTDSRIFHSKTVAAPLWDKAMQNYESGSSAAAMRHLLGLARLAEIAAQNQTPFSGISTHQWQQLFDFAKPEGDLGWADSLLTQAIGSGKGGSTDTTNRTDQYIAAFTRGLPPQNYLILTAEAVDKRQRLFTFIKKSGIAVDCSVAAGSGMAVQKEQKEVLKELVLKTLAGLQKKIDGRALELFFDRVGFHPVAVVMETEKLALYVDDRPQITSQDIDEMVTRTREDALYELTDAFGKGLTGQALTLLSRLQENGTHALAILATMRNYLRKLLIFRSLQARETHPWQPGMTAQQFQNTYLPSLKEQGEWQELLQGHPYALYMSFTKAAEFSCDRLKSHLELLLAAEYRLKGSALPQHIVLEELFLSMLSKKR
jgi:DNA polymerase III subunit delta